MTQDLDNALNAVENHTPEPANDMPVVYEVRNPSDQITIVASNVKLAQVACLIIGRGMYGLTRTTDGKSMLPIFLGSPLKPWWDENFDITFDDFLIQNKDAIADVLDSTVTGDRKQFDAGYEHAADKEAYRKSWENSARSSMNRIEQSARIIAANLRQAVEE